MAERGVKNVMCRDFRVTDDPQPPARRGTSGVRPRPWPLGTAAARPRAGALGDKRLRRDPRRVREDLLADPLQALEVLLRAPDRRQLLAALAAVDAPAEE